MIDEQKLKQLLITLVENDNTIARYKKPITLEHVAQVFKEEPK